jgi:hypothetical protein
VRSFTRMRSIKLLLLLSVFMFSFSAGYAQYEVSGVRFGDLHGEVNVRPNSEDDDAYVFAELTTPLRHDDRIRTSPRSGAILSFSDMTTFVMKEETIIVLDVVSERESKIGLFAGNVWVNLKKMVADGSLEIEMSQAVAGIKGTNITCSSDGTEDRIQVLRGMAEVMIKETKEIIELLEGEEIIIKKGAKPEKQQINVEEVQKKWEKDLERLGSSFELNEVPGLLRNINESSTATYGQISERFRLMQAQSVVQQADVVELRKNAERFVGVVLENILILNSIRRRLDTAAVLPSTIAADRARYVAMLRETATFLQRQQTYQSEASRIMRYEFRTSAISEELAPQLEILRSEFAQVVGEVDAIRAVLQSNPTGMSQDWFKESVDICATTLQNLGEMQQRVANLLTDSPTNVELLELQKSLNGQMSSIARTMRDLSVVEVESSTIVEMQQIDDVMSSQIVTLRNEIDALRAISGGTIDDQERQLASSVKIMSNFARVRRLYLNAQRLYDSVMRRTSSSKFITSEQEELRTSYERISDTFKQLGIVGEELQSNIQDLENQLQDLLR